MVRNKANRENRNEVVLDDERTKKISPYILFLCLQQSKQQLVAMLIKTLFSFEYEINNSLHEHLS
jgi:hypothetical protein